MAEETERQKAKGKGQKAKGAEVAGVAPGFSLRADRPNHLQALMVLREYEIRRGDLTEVLQIEKTIRDFEFWEERHRNG